MGLVVTVAEQGTTCPWAFLNSVEIFLFVIEFFLSFQLGWLWLLLFCVFSQQYLHCWRHTKSLAILKDNGSFEMLESSVQEELIALGYLHEELSTYPPILPWVGTALRSSMSCRASPDLISHQGDREGESKWRAHL